MSPFTTLEQYKGALIAQNFHTFKNPIESIKKAIDDSLQKGLITEEIKTNALKQLEELIKAGEGSKGGKVIGHTRSGKAIYARNSGGPNVNYDGEKDLKDVQDAHFKHEVGKFKSDQKKVDSIYNNKEIKVLHISSKDPLSSQLRKITGDSYNMQDFDESGDYFDKVLTHKKTGKKFASLNEKSAEALGIKKSEDEEIEKAGEGSKGGKVIGHTKSGKAIYEHFDHPEHKNFTKEDHTDAGEAHGKISNKERLARKKNDRLNEDGKSPSEKEKFHSEQTRSHMNIGKEEIKKAYETLGIEYIEKAEGARGGKVIGHTQSGKPIYEDGKHSHYSNFHQYDHNDAERLHSRLADNYRVKRNSHESLRRIAEEDKDRDSIKEHDSKIKEYDEKEVHHSAQSVYHSEESRPESVRDRYSKVGKKVDSIRKQ